MRSSRRTGRTLGLRVALVVAAAAVVVLGPAAAQAQAPKRRHPLTTVRHEHTMCQLMYDAM